MRIRFFNARILTMKEPLAVFNGEVWTKDSIIEKVIYKDNNGNSDLEGVAGAFDREIDCKGNLLMPGFKNAHTHSAMTFLRSLADDMPLFDWLNKQVFPREAKLTPDDIYWLTKLAILEYLTTGVTAIADMYIDNEAVAKACLDSGMRVTLVSPLNNFTKDLQYVEDIYNRYNEPDSLVSACLGFHAVYTTSDELIKGIGELANKYKAPVYVHNSETVSEIEDCKKRTKGLTPTGLLDYYGAYNYGGGAYHGVYLSDGDIEIFKRNKVSVITNPASNAKLASGMAPIERYIKEGINVAIGTDGPASNNCLDMFREMFLLEAFAKLQSKDAAALDAYEVIKMATVGGARAMNLKESDVLDEGKKADMIMIDLHQPNMQPINDIIKNVVYSGSKMNVAITMIDGIIRYEKGNYYIGEDAEALYIKANEIKDRINRE